MRRPLLVAGIAMLSVWSATLRAQSTAPRFLLATADSTAPSVEIAPDRYASYRMRVTLNLGRVPRREALRRIGAASSLQFVYANDLIAAEDTVRLDVADVSVAEALADVLRGAGVDVVVSAGHTVVLVRRRPPTRQAPTDTIRGRITAADGSPIRSARVLVTRGPDRALFQAQSADDGRYEIAVDSGTGDYLVYISVPQQPLLVAFRKRVTRQNPDDAVFVVDAVLLAQQNAQQLSTVRVQTRKPAPVRDADQRAGPGGTESSERGVAAALLPDQAGDLNAVGALMDGATPTTGGVSVFGLPSSQNSVTLNGLAFPGLTVPRDANTTIYTVTNAYDPSRGWYGGANTRVELVHDFVFSTLRTSSSLDTPLLQSGNSSATGAGQNVTSLRQGLGASGWMPSGRMTYNVSAEAGRRTADISTLADADAAMLRRAGVSADSVTRLLQVARQLGIPSSAPGTPGGLEMNSASLLLGVSTVARDLLSYRAVRNVAALTAWASHEDADGNRLQLLGTPAGGARSSYSAGSVQGSWSSFLTPGLLEEVRSSFSVSERHETPNVATPSASVLVGSTFADSPGGLTLTSLGGAISGRSSARISTWESQSDTRFYVGEAHRIRISADLRHDAVTRQTGTNDRGSFFYNSLDDLANARPAMFTRTLAKPALRGGVWNGFISVGDYWSPEGPFELLYGARVEGNVYSMHPAYNPAVETAFGARTDHVPNTVHVSPRLGFKWSYNQSHPSGGVVRNEHGVFGVPQVGVLRGGIGEFRSLMPADLLANASAATGLPTGLQQITCVGTSVPVPDWAAYAASPGAIPHDCATGTGSTSLRDGASPVQVFARDFTAPTSWRASLAWTSYYDAFVWTIEGIYALNRNQPGRVDVNFLDRPSFALSAEGGRPVFVPSSSIVPSSGAVLARDARRSPLFGTVTEMRSNLRSEVSQVTVTVVPDLMRYAKARFFASVSYTLSQARAQQGGFDGPTFASPADIDWSRGAFTPTHAFLAQVSARTRLLNVSLFGRIASGLPYTPMVGNDINGDGVVNDRAFVFDPSNGADQAVGSAMRALLTTGSSGVRYCLSRQLGQPAASNSCVGPWTATMNARIQLNTSQSTGRARRVNASIYVANPLAGLDQLLHGSNLRGWGSPAMPDQVLLRAVGFDPAAGQYRYVVNPRFGSTRPSSNGPLVPFRVTLDIRVDFGTPINQQILDRTLRSGRAGHGGTKRTAGETKRFYTMAARSMNPFRAVLELTDSLLLTNDQVRAVLAGQSRYDVRADSALTAFSSWLAGLPDRYDAGAAMKKQDEFLAAMINIGREEAQASIKPALGAIQLRMLPWPVDLMVRATGPLTLRDVQR